MSGHVSSSSCVSVITRALTFSELFRLVSQTHRKVIAYTFQSQHGNTKDENGHGTHTAGSLVGNALSGADQEFNGMAPDAKIVFRDVSKDTDGVCVCVCVCVCVVCVCVCVRVLCV